MRRRRDFILGKWWEERRHYLVRSIIKGDVAKCQGCQSYGVRWKGWDDLSGPVNTWYCKGCVCWCKGCLRWKVRGSRVCEECRECMEEQHNEN